MIKNLCKLTALACLLMGFQCDDELESEYVYNNYSVRVTPQPTFNVNDTIWLNGRVSSLIFNLTTNDSIFTDNPNTDIVSVYKFINPTSLTNCTAALDKFELIQLVGEVSFLQRCSNAQFFVSPELGVDSDQYKYKIGLRPLEAGDYFISWQNATIQNINRNQVLANSYPIPDQPNQLGFDTCGQVSWRYLNESKYEYFFTVN